MHDRYLGRLEPGLDVCDVNGDKIGTLSRVYRHELAPVGAGVGVSSSGGTAIAERDEILEVKTGLFGLGKHLYIPLSAIQDLTSGSVFVNRARDAIDNSDWAGRPDHLDQLT